MTVRQSPTVHYPLCRVRWLPWAWWCVLGASGLLLGMWGCYGAGVGEQLWRLLSVAAAFLLVCSWSGRLVAMQQPQGWLHWNGRCWAWEQPQQMVVFEGAAHVLLDVQWLLIVCWSDAQQRKHRFVLEKKWEPFMWMDLRRAVYSSASLSQSQAVAER